MTGDGGVEPNLLGGGFYSRSVNALIMDKIDDVSEYLDSQAQQGTTVETDLEFTISAEEAWERVSAHVMPFKGAWALELIKAAVSFHCAEIQIRQHTKQTDFYLLGTQPWDGALILKALLNYGAEVPRAYHYLAVALRVLSKTEGNPFKLILGDRELASWDGHDITLAELSHTENENCLAKPLLLYIDNNASSDRSMLSKLFKSEERSFIATVNRLLYERAFCCPIPLTCDTRSVRGMHAYPLFAPCARTRPLFCLNVDSDEDLPGFQPPDTSAWITGRKAMQAGEGEPSHLEAPEPGHEVGGVALLSTFLQTISCDDSFFIKKSETLTNAPARSLSQLLWVKDGVVVGIEEMDTGSLGFGMLVLGSAEGLKTDVSGYDMVRDEAYDERRRRLMAKAAKAVLNAVNTASLHAYEEAHLSIADAVVRGVGGVIGLFLGVVPGIVLLADLAYGYSKVDDLNEKAKSSFARSYEEFSTRLETYAQGKVPEGQVVCFDVAADAGKILRSLFHKKF